MPEYRWIWAFIVIIGCGALWVSFTATKQMWHYSLLTAHCPVETLDWRIIARDNEHYLLEGTYTYCLKNNIYMGITKLPSPVYRNAWAAEEGLKEERSQPRQVWYAPHKPDFSSLYRAFPLKEICYAATMWALVCYFIGLLLYLQKR